MCGRGVTLHPNTRTTKGPRHPGSPPARVAEPRPRKRGLDKGSLREGPGALPRSGLRSPTIERLSACARLGCDARRAVAARLRKAGVERPPSSPRDVAGEPPGWFG